MTEISPEVTSKRVTLARGLLPLLGTAYIAWSFIVQLAVPGAYESLPQRLAASALCFVVPGMSYFSAFVRRNIRPFALACAWVITLHAYFLLYANHGDPNFMVGCYVTVIAISLCTFSNRALAFYSAFNLVLALTVTLLVPEMRATIFLPGLCTILLPAHLGYFTRNSALKNLADSNARFHLLFNSTFEGLLVHEKGKILSVNGTGTKLLGRDPEELIGMSVLDVIHPADRALVAERVARDEEPPVYEIRVLTRNGSSLELEVRGKNFVYNGRPARLVTINNITDRKKAEMERITALTAQENVRIRDEFISIASHELKTPISALKLQTQLLEREQARGQSPSDLKQVLALLNRQIDRLTDLVDTMLDVSRISSGRFVLERHRLDLPVLMREVIAAQKILASSVDIHFEGLEHLEMLGDRSRLEQVLENLLSNAVKYGEGRPIAVRLRQDNRDNGLAILEIQDEGIGITPDFLPKIFNRFERGVSARNISGLGLGLYISKQILDGHGGTISAASEPGKGSRFTVTLPIN